MANFDTRIYLLQFLIPALTLVVSEAGRRSQVQRTWADGPFTTWAPSSWRPGSPDCSCDTFSDDGGNMGGMTILQSPFEFANSAALGCCCLAERMWVFVATFSFIKVRSLQRRGALYGVSNSRLLCKSHDAVTRFVGSSALLSEYCDAPRNEPKFGIPIF